MLTSEASFRQSHLQEVALNWKSSTIIVTTATTSVVHMLLLSGSGASVNGMATVPIMGSNNSRWFDRKAQGSKQTQSSQDNKFVFTLEVFLL